jgi:hypothetical protein
MRTQKEANILFGLFFILTILWVLVRLPSPAQVLADADGGHQLAGATQILHGEHPFVDFKATYGPFTFYASAVAQILFNHRVIGEIILIALGYAITYALLSRLIYRVTGNFFLTLLFGMLALAAIPRLYKYYIALGPVLTLFTAWNYLEKPDRKNMLWMALAITLTGLFRSDFGVYCTITGVVAVLLALPFTQGGIKRIITLLGAVLLFASPWLLFLTIKGNLIDYFYTALAGGANIAAGASLPFPAFHSGFSAFALVTNLISLAIIFFSSLPFIILIWLLVRWESLDPLQKKMLLTAVVLNMFSLIQATYRYGYPHLLQAIPLGFALSAWATRTLSHNLALAVRSRQKIRWLYSAALVLLTGFLLIPVMLVNQSLWPPIDPLGIPYKLEQFSLPKEQVLVNIEKISDSWYAQAMLYTRRCTTDRQRLMALPVLTTFSYFTDRAFGGGQIGLASGYFVTDADQARIIGKMSAEDIPLIVYLPNFEFDGIPQRKMEVFALRVSAYVQQNYVRIKQIGPASLLMRNDLKIDQLSGKLAEMSCPHP